MDFNKRHTDYGINELVFTRWSPRAYSGNKIPQEKLHCILEAARWAPSCFNEQPWRFIVASEEKSLGKFVGFLADANKEWAQHAPVLIAALAKTDFSQNGKSNRWSSFDAGCAWGYLALEARRQGLYAHAMGGFDKAKAKEVLKVPDNYDVMAIIALGEMGDVNELSQANKERELPSDRKALESLVFYDEFK